MSASEDALLRDELDDAKAAENRLRTAVGTILAEVHKGIRTGDHRGALNAVRLSCERALGAETGAVPAAREAPIDLQARVEHLEAELERVEETASAAALALSNRIAALEAPGLPMVATATTRRR